VNTIKSLELQYPAVSETQRQQIAEARAKLMAEGPVEKSD
jgi:hypothetical protein